MEALKSWLADLAQRIIGGERLNKEQALALSQIEGQEAILLLCILNSSTEFISSTSQ
jgi:biotin synthase